MVKTHIKKQHFIKTSIGSDFSIAYANQLHGKELSYNNIQDANAAIQIVKEFKIPAAVAVKHMNPCGVGLVKQLQKHLIKHTKQIQHLFSVVLLH